jgi:hypothetical protein
MADRLGHTPYGFLPTVVKGAGRSLTESDRDQVRRAE